MEWTEVKPVARPFKLAKRQDNPYDIFTVNKSTNIFTNSTGVGAVKPATNKQASAIASFDPIRDSDEEIKYELVSHECSESIQKARLAKEWTQA